MLLRSSNECIFWYMINTENISPDRNKIQSRGSQPWLHIKILFKFWCLFLETKCAIYIGNKKVPGSQLYSSGVWAPRKEYRAAPEAPSGYRELRWGASWMPSSEFRGYPCIQTNWSSKKGKWTLALAHWETSMLWQCRGSKTQIKIACLHALSI